MAKDEFVINEFVESIKEKITLATMSYTHYLIFFNYEKISEENKQRLVSLLVPNLEKAM